MSKKLLHQNVPFLQEFTRAVNQDEESISEFLKTANLEQIMPGALVEPKISVQDNASGRNASSNPSNRLPLQNASSSSLPSLQKQTSAIEDSTLFGVAQETIHPFMILHDDPAENNLSNDHERLGDIPLDSDVNLLTVWPYVAEGRRGVVVGIFHPQNAPLFIPDSPVVMGIPKDNSMSYLYGGVTLAGEVLPMWYFGGNERPGMPASLSQLLEEKRISLVGRFHGAELHEMYPRYKNLEDAIHSREKPEHFQSKAELYQILMAPKKHA